MSTENSMKSNTVTAKPLWEQIVPWVSPVVALLLIMGLYLIGPTLNRSDLRIVTFTLMWVGLASSWNMIGGYTGYIDFGHTVFVGVGGYAVGILVARLGILMGHEDIALQRAANWDFIAALPISFFAGAIFAGLVGWPTLRLKGPYFAIAMLGTYVAGREIMRNNPFDLTNGGKGLSFLAPFSKPNDIFIIMLLLTGTIFSVSLLMYRVQLGKMLKAVRDDEVGADMRGMNTSFLKIGVFMLAGGFTAMIGGTKAYWDGYIDPETIFPATYTIEIIMMTMLGGIGRPWGPVVGAVIFYYGKTVIWANLGGFHLIVTGVLLATIVMFMPGGILGLFDPEDRGLVWFIRTRILGQKEKVFDDSEDFQFQDIPTDSTAKRVLSSGDDARVIDRETVVLQGEGIIKDFGGLRAVNQVDFEIYKGEVVGLIGPNGSGKTTLFNCISGILPLTEGRVWVAGQEVTGLDPWRINRHGLGRTFQRLRIFGKQTVYDNMLLARKWKGVPAWLWLTVVPHDIQQKANELLDFLQIDHVKNNQGNNLSGGQQRLLEIGMTLMCDPEIVLLDEATSGVNPTLIEDIKDSIRHLNRVKGVTFLLIEHNMVFTMDLCDRLYVLDYGSLIASGTPEEIQNNDKVIEAYFGRDE